MESDSRTSDFPLCPFVHMGTRTHIHVHISLTQVGEEKLGTKMFIETLTNYCFKILKHKNVIQVYGYLHYKLHHLTNKITIL